MIIVTGAAGFIGSNIIRQLNKLGERDIIAVDALQDGRKYQNLVGLEISDYLDKDHFLEALKHDVGLANAKGCFHQGACSATTEWNGHYLMKNNYEYSKSLHAHCVSHGIPFIYASSASVYGASVCQKRPFTQLQPLNPYAYSKLLFDRYVGRFHVPDSQVVGLRYFNVYGPGEQHKGQMASVMFHFYQQIRESGSCKLFGEFDGYEAGGQKRDFIYVDDIVDINIWMWKNPHVSGIFNCGTGEPAKFNQVADEIVSQLGEGGIQYVDFPEHLKGAYQSYTCADISALREVGYQPAFTTLNAGIKKYLAFLSMNTHFVHAEEVPNHVY